MEEMVIFKLNNSLNGLFETCLTIQSQKARDENNLSNLSSFISNLEDKKGCMKQTIRVNPAQS